MMRNAFVRALVPKLDDKIKLEEIRDEGTRERALVRRNAKCIELMQCTQQGTVTAEQKPK